MAAADLVWFGDRVLSRARLAESGLPLSALIGAQGAAAALEHHGHREVPVDGWRVIEGALPADPTADVTGLVMIAPWTEPRSNGWMIFHANRRAAVWEVAREGESRPIEPYVPPEQRWPQAIPLFDVAWHVTELEFGAGRVVAPSRIVGLTFRPRREHISAAAGNPEGQVGPLAICEAISSTHLHVGHWVHNLMFKPRLLDGEQETQLFRVLRDEVAWSMLSTDGQRGVEFTKPGVGRIRASANS